MVSAAKELLREAQTLAQFANLEPSRVDEFRNAVDPGFVPAAWWTGVTIPPSAIWQMEQRRLREAWRLKFPPEHCIEMIVSAYRFSELDRAVQAASGAVLKMSNEDAKEFLSATVLPPPQVWPFQRAVMFLHVQPWRAEVCGICGKCFVKEKQGSRFCSPECSAESHRRSKRGWWAESGSKRRAKKHSRRKR